MRRLFQFVAFGLVLLLLVPVASASVFCRADAERRQCPKHCCAGMDAAAMDSMGMSTAEMSRISAPMAADQLTSAACCTLAVHTAQISAATESLRTQQLVALLPLLLLHLQALPTEPMAAAEIPPGPPVAAPSAARLCTFLL